jgi:hypothetical protein
MGTDEWLTPPEIVQALGPFDLDPCSPVDRPWDTARIHYTIKENGLWQKWEGRVWLNPPYGSQAEKWLERLAQHGNGIALIFARTETRAFFHYVWNRADAVLFLYGRLFFYRVNGSQMKSNSGAPSVLVAYGEENIGRLEQSGIQGKFITLKNNRGGLT